MQSKVLSMAIAVGLGVTFAGAAVAAPKQTTRAEVSAAALEARDREIADLKQQLADLAEKVGALEERTDAQSEINANTQQSVEAAQATGSQVEKLSKLVSDTTFGGKLYVDVTNLNQKNHGVDTNASGLGIDVKRFYLSATHQFNDVWSANLTTDFNYVSNDGETNVFVKKAYLQGKFSDAAILRIGSADMPWIPYVEGFYGFRYVENTLTDKLKFGNSADWGLHLGGQVGTGVNYAVSAVNGGGYKNPTRSKRMDVEGRVGFSPFKNAVIAVGAYSGALGKETQSVGAVHTADRFDILAAYAKDNTRFGVEYFRARNWNNVLSLLSDKADGYSVWGSIGVGDKAVLFARYDQADLSKDLNPSLEDSYFNLGLEFPIRKGVKMSAVYKHDSLKDSGPIALQSDEFGIWGEVAF